MIAAADPLMALAMWEDWQAKVRAALPRYAASPWFLEQDSQRDSDVDAVVAALPVTVDDRSGQTRDVAHGARVFQSRRGAVTRAWVDGQVEIDFLRRALHLVGVPLALLEVLDIGAGYGRLAAMLAPLVRDYTCVDAVPVSVEVCRDYTRRYAPAVQVLDVPALRTAIAEGTLRPNLAINIHSWNECGSAHIANWLDALDHLRVPFLFTVSHGQNADVVRDGSEESYRTWGPGLPSFRPLLLERYALVAEESIGISRHPHALWMRTA